MDNNNPYNRTKDITSNLALIIDRAMSNSPHIQDKFLRTIDEFAVAAVYWRGMKKIVKAFKKTIKKCQKDYLHAISIGANVFGSLIVYAEFCWCLEYYKEELRLVNDLLEDYQYYMFDGNVIRSLLGYVRPEEDLVKYTSHGRSDNGK